MAVFASAHHVRRSPCALYTDDIDGAMLTSLPPPSSHERHDTIIHPQVGDPHTYFQQQRRANNSKYPNYDRTPARQCGIIQIIVGFTLIITSYVMLRLDAWGSGIGVGFWGCMFYFTAGMFGLLAYRFRTTCYILSSTVCSMVTCFLSLAVVTMASIGIAVDTADYGNPKLALHSVNLILGFMGAVAAYVQLRRGGSVICRKKRTAKSEETNSEIPPLNEGSRTSLSRPVSLNSVVISSAQCHPPPYPGYIDKPSPDLPPSYEEVMRQLKSPSQSEDESQTT